MKAALQNADWQAKLEEDGYCVIPFLSEVGLNSLKDLFNSFPDLPNSGFHFTMGVPDPEHRKQVDRGIKQCFQEAFSEQFADSRILYANFLVKQPGPEGDFPVHTDWTYVDESSARSYAIWVPLQDVDASNGSVKVFGSSHKLDGSPRGPFVLFPYQNLVGTIKEKHLKTLSIKAGEALIWDHGLVHASAPNTTDAARIAATAIVIPEGEQAIHIAAKHDSDGKTAEIFEVDTDFYMHYQIGQRPGEGATFKEEKQFDIPLLTEEDLQPEEGTYQATSKRVADYYDEIQHSYDKHYGDIIQAFRPQNNEELLSSIMKSADIQDGQRILDAGCGVGAPAIYFAQHKNVEIEGATISPVQVEQALEKIAAAGLQDRVRIKEGDFHELDKLYQGDYFDSVLFLESLGHAAEAEEVVQSAYEVLKKGGHIYIKDFYYKVPADKTKYDDIQNVISKVNDYYNYNCLDLNDTLYWLRRTGFEIELIKPFGFQNDITRRLNFEIENKIDLYNGGDEYAFAEWLEIKCIKPWNPL